MRARGKKRSLEDEKAAEKKDKPEVEKGNWKTDGTVMIGEYGAFNSEKIVSFDLDFTLIKTKSGATFPKNKDDWVLWDACVPEKVKEYFDKGYKFVIFTNQGGIGAGKITDKDFMYKADSIHASFNIPLTIVAATEDDKYHKPSKGMWEYFTENLNGGIKVDLTNSYYIGDAAGRPAKGKKKKDFADSDLKFSMNVGLKFQTPEEFFLGEKPEPGAELAIGFDPTKVATSGAVFKGGYEWGKVTGDAQEVVLFVGPPASGKSTFWQNYMKDYERINRDTLKTKEKCIVKMKEALTSGKSCVIDNTNPTKVDRKLFIDIAKELKMPVRCFWFNIEKPMALHLDKLRKTNTDRVHLSGHVGKIPIATFFKKFEAPEKEEGFEEIKEVQFVAKFANEKDESAFKTIS